MKKVRFIHAADFHLDASLSGSSMNARQRKERQRELLDTFISVIDKAIGEKVDFLIIAGDLFEHRTVRRSTIEEIYRQFQRIPHIPIFITPGNHDPLLANSYYRILKWPAHVHIFGGHFQKIELSDLSVDLYGFGYESYRITNNPFETLSIEKNSHYKILTFHGSYLPGKGVKDDYLSFTQDLIPSLEVDYIALGHFHECRRIEGRGEKPVCFYSGCPEPIGFDEMGEKGVLLVELDGSRIGTSFIRTQKRQYHTVQLDLSPYSTSYDVYKGLESLQFPGNPDLDIYRVNLVGAAHRGLHLDLNALNQWFCSKRYRGVIVDQSQDEYDLNYLREDRGLAGMFLRKMEKRIASEPNGKKREILQMAMTYGLDALLGGEVREE